MLSSRAARRRPGRAAGSRRFGRCGAPFYALLTLLSAGVLTYYSWREKEFLFFLYSNITAYIAITYLIFKLIERMNDGYFILVYYFPASCIGYIFYLIKKKSHFAHD